MSKPPTPIAERLWPRVVDGPVFIDKRGLSRGPCQIWTGYIGQDGYGQIAADGGGDRVVAVHVAAYQLRVGEVPTGLVLDHLCRNRACVNASPDPYKTHLEPVTHRVNILRGEHPPAFYATRAACKYDHSYTPENTFIYRGYRCCRTCNREKQRARRTRMGGPQ